MCSMKLLVEGEVDFRTRIDYGYPISSLEVHIFFVCLFCFWLLWGSQHVGSIPLQGSNPSLLHWECRVLATGPPRKFPGSSYLLIKSWEKISSSVYDCWHGWSEIKVAHGLYSPWDSPGQNTEVGTIPFSRDWTQVFLIAGGFFTSWATRKADRDTRP